jgi:eukaryotic-like serine/threonine-protein kinase
MLADPKQIETIFHAALAKADPAERAAFLVVAAGEDIELRHRVERLIDAHDELGALLGPSLSIGRGGINSRISSLATDRSAVPTPVEELGDRVGQYRLLQKLGEGGMGTVWVAEQEQPVRRRVALKLIKPGMDSARVIARFEAERQALALMDHTNIAKILDAGTAPSGRPYFVMELVKGVPITRYCDELHLGIRERLELFVQVCAAVQHAHQKGVIHRDLKPSNVLVAVQDGKPIPKVIDFGVAKALFTRLADRTMYTEIGAVIGTLEYMAPEQAELSALDVDTRADVYALGVLLYELITGSTPLTGERVKSVALSEALRLIREEEPPLPSARLGTTVALPTIAAARRVESARLGQMVRGELDWIVMRALEKDRTRRYESASGLARDVERHLNDEPVEACPPSTWYRLRKLARKNRGPVAAAGVVLLALLVGVIGTTVGLIEARDQERRAVAEAEASKKARTNEEEQRRTAENQKEQAWLHLYVARIQAAQQAWRDGNIGRVRELLEETRPGPAQHDLRAFEWFYLRRLADDQPQTLRHPTQVRKVVFSADGRFVAAAGEAGRIDTKTRKNLTGDVTVWEVATGRVVRSFPSEPGEGSAVALGPTGKLLARVTGDGAVEIWDLDADRLAISLPGGPDAATRSVQALAFSPDGAWLAVGHGQGHGDAPVKVWNVPKGQLLQTFRGHRSFVNSLAFSPDGQRLASSGQDEFVKVWDVIAGRETLNIKSRIAFVSGVAFNPYGTRLASAGEHGVKVWDARTGEEVQSLSGHSGGVSSVAFSPDGGRLASGGHDRSVRVWDLETGREAFSLKGHLAGVWAVAFSPDGKRLASGSGDRTIKVWDATRNPEARVLGLAMSVAFRPDGRRFATGAPDKTIRILDAADGSEVLRLDGVGATLAFSPDGRRLAGTASYFDADQAVKVWDTTTGKQLLDLSEPDFRARGVAFSPDNQLVAASGVGEIEGLRVWDSATGRRVLSLRAVAPITGSLAFTPAGDRVAASTGRQVIVWDVASGREAQSFDVRDGRAGVVTISEDGRWLAAGVHESDQPTAAIVWDLETGQQVFRLGGLTEAVTCLAFSPDSQRLVAGTGGFGAGVEKPSVVKVWELRTGQAVLELPAGLKTVRAVVFTPDGKCLASAGDVLRMWDATLRSAAAPPNRHSAKRRFVRSASARPKWFRRRCVRSRLTGNSR